VLGSYELEAELGRGAQGAVFRARHRPTGALRAVKVLEGDLDPESVERFRREAQALARAGGVALAVHEVGHEPGRMWFAMELCSGGSLRARLRERGPLDWREAVALVSRIARGLDRCHELGLVHRDLKPENVLFDDEGDPRIADWGLVRDFGRSRLTATGIMLGSPAYMPPEQLEGRPVDRRADVFALGVMLHELVVGARPFGGESPLQIGRAIHAGKRERVAGHGAPARLDQVLDRALAAGADDRTASAALLADELDAVLVAPEAGASRRLPLVALALAALAVVGGALVARRRTSEPEQGPLPRETAPTAAEVKQVEDFLDHATGVVASGSAPWRIVRSRPRLLEIAAQHGVVYDLGGVRELAALDSSKAVAALAALASIGAGDHAGRSAARVALAAAGGPVASPIVRTLDAAAWFEKQFADDPFAYTSPDFKTEREWLEAGLPVVLAEPVPFAESALEPLTLIARRVAWAKDTGTTRVENTFGNRLFVGWGKRTDILRHLPPRFFGSLFLLGEIDNTSFLDEGRPRPPNVLERNRRWILSLGQLDATLAGAAICECLERQITRLEEEVRRVDPPDEALDRSIASIDLAWSEIEADLALASSPDDVLWAGVRRHDLLAARAGVRQALAVRGREGEFARAVDDYQRALAALPRDLPAEGRRWKDALGIAFSVLGRDPERVDEGAMDPALFGSIEHHPLGAEIRRRQGRPGEALDLLSESARRRLEAEKDQSWMPTYHAVRALALVDLRRLDEARQEVAALAALPLREPNIPHYSEAIIRKTAGLDH